MVKKVHKSDNAAAPKSSADMSQTIKESAQQIWLAGLGSFSKAQAEGGKVFETLVKEGVTMQRKTQAAAEEKISEATSKMAGMATEIASKATGQWGKLEDIFETRVAKALGKLGVPSAQDIAALVERIDALSQAVAKLGGSVSPKPVAKPVAKPAAKAATQKAVKPVAKPVKAAAKPARKASAKTAGAPAAPAPKKRGANASR
jgi:poly(hydroxyalkanoate) granule-associated protein